MKAPPLQTGARERPHSKPVRMKGTFTRTYGVKVPFMRDGGGGYALAQGPVPTRAVALRPAAASLVTSSAVSA